MLARLALLVACVGSFSLEATFAAEAEPRIVRSAASGRWSNAATWTGGQVPAAGDKVFVAVGHEIVFDAKTTDVIRSVHLDGTLRFAPDLDTKLRVGLIRIGAGGTTDERGFDCEAHAPKASAAALIVGTREQPIYMRRNATIELHYIEGMDKQSCPAIVCCGGRMELHGTPLERTWVKLGAPAQAGATELTVQNDIGGWRVGDRVIVTATVRQQKTKKTFKPSTADSTQTEERLIAKLDGRTVTLDKPLEFAHTADGDYRADVANLSRNVVVESADPAGVRGHTMYHRESTGSISYAEFRHLGKDGTLGRYSLHFHLCGDTMRGASVVGAAIWDSHNRWITIHGTNYLVVRDCVGYKSRGHGFFLEDGTETCNVLDRNLAVQAYIAKPLPQQVLPYDKNDGSGFWWANCLNSFTRNTAAECDEYGFFFQAVKTDAFDPVLSIRQSDGSTKPVDIRTLPFLRFDENEVHCQRRHGFNLGGGVPFGPPNVAGVGPDAQHPFVLRNFRCWNVHWAVHPVSPSVLLDGLTVHHAEYGVWRPEYKQHAYRNLKFDDVPEKHHYAFTATNQPPNDEAQYPNPLEPVDDLPPATVITNIAPSGTDKLLVRGTTVDNGDVTSVTVNGVKAKPTRPNFAEWEAVVDVPTADKPELTAGAVDAKGNKELTPHRVRYAP